MKSQSRLPPYKPSGNWRPGTWLPLRDHGSLFYSFCVLVKEGNFEVGVLLAKFTRPPVKSDVRFSLPPQGSFCHSTWLIKTGGTWVIQISQVTNKYDALGDRGRVRHLGCTQEAFECKDEDILGLYRRPLRGAMWVVWVGDHFKGFVWKIWVANQGQWIDGIEGVSHTSRSLFGLREWPINSAVVGVQPLEVCCGVLWVANQGHRGGGAINHFSGKAFLSNKRTCHIVWQLHWLEMKITWDLDSNRPLHNHAVFSTVVFSTPATTALAICITSK